jgi:hypothetical protein
MAEDVVASTETLLAAARAAARTEHAAARIDAIIERLHGPLLVAIAGRVKAGKSTLLNGLLGESLAAVDAGECTKLLTWYRRASFPQVTLVPVGGAPVQAVFRRSAGELEIELGGREVEEIDHLEVGWPTPRLASMTLVDTPGIGSISIDVSARTQQMLTPDDDRPSAVDAIIYLLRHTHASDAHFLEAFHDDEVGRGSPLNVVGVLSRADEIGACRMDSLEVADRVARRYQADPRLRRLCPIVVPVAGLLGYAGATLREAEFRALAEVAELPAEERHAILLTADRFRYRESAPLTEIERAHLLERLGLFGVRLAVDLISRGATADAAALAAELTRRSGLERLREVLARQFGHRSQLLKVRSALAALQEVLHSEDLTGAPSLQIRIEQLVAGTHEFTELRLLTNLRTEDLNLSADRAAELDRLLGGSGHDPAVRLGLPEDADQEAIRDSAIEALNRWQRTAAHPLSSRTVQVAAQGACRTLEGIIAAGSADQMSPSRST